MQTIDLSRKAPRRADVRQPWDWSERGWAAIANKYKDFAQECLSIFVMELRHHMITHPDDFDRLERRNGFEAHLALLIRQRTGKVIEVTECVLRDRQRGEDPPNTIALDVVWDDGVVVQLELNDQMTSANRPRF